MLSTAYLKSFLSSYLINKEGPLRDFYFQTLRPAYLRFEGNRELKQWTRLGKTLFDDEEVRAQIRDHLERKAPYTIAKIGGNELCMLQWMQGHSITETKFTDLHQNAGIFPTDRTFLRNFAEEFSRSLKSLSLLGLWMGKGEPDMYQKTDMIADVTCLETFCGRFEEIALGYDRSWFQEMRGYRIMVISSFADQIAGRANQNDWDLYWNGRLPWIAPAEIIPATFPYGFESDTQRTFGDSLRLMDEFKRLHESALLRSDLVLVACGAHAIPLLDWIHQHGKVGVHMGANIQLLFGIKGGRWDNRDGPLGALYNDHWVRPLAVPATAQKVERSCYW